MSLFVWRVEFHRWESANEMQRHSDEEQLILNYLLGALPESELERFEGRFLGDETLFEELQEIEDELIDDYVSGGLTTVQRAQFEEYFLRSPKRRERLEFARAMTEHALAWKGEAQPAISPLDRKAESTGAGGAAGKLLPFNLWSRPVPAWREWAALAAMVLIAVGSSVLWLRNRELHRELVAAEAHAAKLRREFEAQSALSAETNAQLSAEQQQTQKLEEQLEKLQKSVSAAAVRKVIVTAILGVEYLVQGTRGGSEGKVKTLALPANAGMVRLGVQFQKSRFDSFKLLLRRADGRTVWTRGGVMARAVGDKENITISIPAENLPQGNYELIVSGVPATGDAELVGRYYLKLERKEIAK